MEKEKSSRQQGYVLAKRKPKRVENCINVIMPLRENHSSEKGQVKIVS